MRSAKGKCVLPIISAIVIIFILVSASALMPAAQATNGPKNVLGYVYDQNGDPIAGANVTVNMRKPDTTIRSTLWYDATDSDGYYSVTFGMGVAEWVEGDTIETIATFGMDSASNTTIATSYPIQYVNVTIAIVIPEFGLFGSFSVLAMSMAMAAALLIARRRKQG